MVNCRFTFLTSVSLILYIYQIVVANFWYKGEQQCLKRAPPLLAVLAVGFSNKPICHVYKVPFHS